MPAKGAPRCISRTASSFFAGKPRSYRGCGDLLAFTVRSPIETFSHTRQSSKDRAVRGREATWRRFILVFQAGATRLGGGEFYPKGLTQKRELQFASRAVNSIEINGSFLRPATARTLCPVVRRNPGGLRLQRQGSAFLSPISSACGTFINRWRISLPPGCWSSRKKTRPDPLAISAQLQIRPGIVRKLSRTITPRHGTGRRPRTPT